MAIPTPITHYVRLHTVRAWRWLAHAMLGVGRVLQHSRDSAPHLSLWWEDYLWRNFATVIHKSFPNCFMVMITVSICPWCIHISWHYFYLLICLILMVWISLPYSTRLQSDIVVLSITVMENTLKRRFLTDRLTISCEEWFRWERRNTFNCKPVTVLVFSNIIWVKSWNWPKVA